MATIVKHLKLEQNFILLGTGFGQYHSARESIWGGVWFPKIEDGTSMMACICDAEGTVSWVLSGLVKVISIDGQSIEEISNTCDLATIPNEIINQASTEHLMGNYETSKDNCNMCFNKALKDELFCIDHIQYGPNAKKYGK